MIPISGIGAMLATPSNVVVAGGTLLPVVFIALLIDVLMVSAWYMIGAVLNRSEIKASALAEYYQFLGTAVVIVIVISVLATFSTLFYSTLGSTKLMSNSKISGMCSQIEATSGLDILGPENSILSGASSAQGTQNLVGLCSIVGNGGDLTTAIDYPLAATTVITANMTNQMAINLNDAFIFDSYIGFLSRLNATLGVCISVETEGAACYVPLNPIPPDFKVGVAYTPYGGYGIMLADLGVVGTLMTTSLEAYLVQLIGSSVMLFVWPWLLFAGILLRSNFVTRPIGGLFIAIAIGAMLIYPLVYSIEYLTLGNGITGGTIAVGYRGVTYGITNSIYGFNYYYGGLPSTLAGTGGGAAPYTLNFFVMPRVAEIANSFNCWVPTNSKQVITGPVQSFLLPIELLDYEYLLVPGPSVIQAAKQINGILKGTTPTFYLPYTCAPSDALNIFDQLLNAYGIIGVTAYFLPIINLIITITSVIGISSLLGGDTSLAGLSRFF